MRILVAHLVGSARSGGMTRLMGRVHDELQQAGHHVEYLTADDVPAPMRGRLGRGSFQFAVWRRAAAAARTRRPFDIINVHEPHGAVVASIRAGTGQAAVVAMTHGVERRGWEVALAHAPSHPSLKTRLIYPATSLWLSRATLTRADHVICLNRQDREFLADRFGVDRSRVTPITPGADSVFGRAAAARSYAGARRLLFAGTWIPRKGIVELATAFNALVDQGRDVCLDIVGAGVPDSEILRRFTARAATRLRVLGSGDETMTSAAMAEADIFVLPSLFEGTPLTIVEAMWSGLPVVTTETAGMQDVVQHERTGLLVPPGDAGALAAALGRVVDDGGLRQAIGREAHRVASREYTWAHAAAAFESAYEAARAHHVQSAN